MRIAVSGAHRTGKTTLIDELAGTLPAFVVVDEPYVSLVEEGHLFAEPPSLEDFELQLERAIESLAGSDDACCLFDRCPFDLVAYLLAHENSDAFDLERWLPRVGDAVRSLDLVIFVPIEVPDRVLVAAGGFRALRRQVDEELRDIVLGDRWGFGVPAIEVAGPTAARVRQALAFLEAAPEPR